MPRSSLLPLILLIWCFAAAPAEASEFWDAVRNPGLATYRARLHAGLQALGDNRPAHALEAADSALALLPDRPEAHVLRGRALAARRAYDLAHAAFERAVSLDAQALDEWPAGYAAATTALQLGELDSATHILTRVLSTLHSESKRAQTLTLQGDILLARGPEHLQRARLTYREALRSDQRARGALLGLSLSIHREGYVDEALHLAARLGGEPRQLGNWALPESERLARRALWLHAVDDLVGAREAWLRASKHGPWAEHAARAARRLSGAKASAPTTNEATDEAKP